MNFRSVSARSLGCILGIVSALVAVPKATGAPVVATESAVFVERVDAGTLRSLEPADQLNPGDRVVTIVTWRRRAGDGAFTITNPLPPAIAYQASTREDQEVSVDGGRSWGRLGALRSGNRLATPEDVTHMRWRIPAESALKGRGQIVYSGIVR